MTASNRSKQNQSRVSRKQARARRALVESIEPRILMSADVITKLADFTTTSGTLNVGGMIIDSQGNLYGSNVARGANSDGTVFELAAGTNTVTTVAAFSSSTGTNPYGGLLRDSSGDLFGITDAGGANHYGTVFEIAANTGTVTTLASFNYTDGAAPQSNLIRDSAGNLFGTALAGGGSGDGAVFEIAANTNTITDIASFDGTDGTNPSGNLVTDSSGDLFGTTSTSVFEIAHGTTAITNLGNFTSSTGTSPENGLVIDSSGNLYGDTETGGANGNGTVFEVADGSDTITVLASFGSTTGTDPIGGLAIDSSGNLFGTTQGGGDNGKGTIFELASGGSTITPLASSSTATGYASRGSLVLDSAGKLYGTTSSGGANGFGTVFSAAPATSTQAVITAQPTSNVTAGTSQSISVSLENDLGVVDATNQGTVTLSLASGPGLATVGGTLSVAAVNGVATFPGLTFDTAGAYTLTASSAGLTSDTTNSITVVPAAASQLAVSQQPTAAVAGQAIGPVIVDVEDAFGNLVTTDTSPVTITTSDGAAVSGTTTVSAVAGVATFADLSVGEAGLHTLSAADGSLTPATSSGFSIIPNVAAQLVFDQQPTTTAAGLAIGVVTVDVDDAFGNLITSDTSPITVSNNDTAALNGTTTASAIGGVATFSALSIQRSGTHTLTASDGNLGSGTSNPFIITPGAATQLVVVGQPTSATVGQSIGAVAIEVEDAFGNLAASNQSNVTLSAELTGAVSAGVSSAGSALTGTTTLAARNGVAVFDGLSIATDGNYSLSATDAALTPAVSAALTISGTPAPTNVLIAGKKIAPLVINTSTAFPQSIGVLKRLSVRIQSASGGKTVLSETIRVKNSRAILGNLNIHKAGVYNVVISDANGQSMTQQLAIVASAPAQLSFVTQPNFVNGQSAVAVRVLDRYGNLSTAADGTTVTLQLGPHPILGSQPTLGGTLTATVDNGLASFPDVTVNQNGRARLLASDGKLRPARSNVFSNA
jgi:uncharacterized repeat protein (TIGR03803 family)